MTTFPHISIVIPTYNAPEDVQRCLLSLAAVTYPSWDILIVDQSDDTRTQNVVEGLVSRIPQVRYRHRRTKGTCHARNVGLAETRGDIIGFLDHDCTVEPDWLMKVADVLDRHPQAAHIFGDVRTPDGSPEWGIEGWTPTVKTAQEFEASTIGSMHNRLTLPHLTSMGAHMFVRREAAQCVGFFDVHFGPGSRFPSSEDGDYTYRTLRSGYSVVRTPAIWVAHHGFRDYQSGAAARHLRTYQYSTGAWHMKVLRLGDPFALAWILKELWKNLQYVQPQHLIRRRGPTGLSHVAIYVLGLVGSFQLRVDRRSQLYAARTLQSNTEKRVASGTELKDSIHVHG